MPLATKLSRSILSWGLSHMTLQSSGYNKSRDKLKPLYLHYHSRVPTAPKITKESPKKQNTKKALTFHKSPKFS